MKRKIILILLSIMMCFSFTGCWDKVEIDKKLFISTIGIDSGKDIEDIKKSKDIDPTEPFQQREMNVLRVTYGYPNISELGPGKTGSAQEKTISVDAHSMEDSISKAISKSSRDIYLGQARLLILGSDIMKNKQAVEEILDYFKRNPEIDNMMYVLISSEKTEDLIKYTPDMEKNVEQYFEGLMSNSSKSSVILPVRLTEMFNLMSSNGNAIIPYVVLDRQSGELKLNGVAMIKNFTLAGYLNPTETSDLEILRGKLKAGNKVIYEKGHPVDYLIDGVDRKVKVEENKGKYKFDIDISLEGQLTGYYYNSNVLSIDKLSKFQDDFSKSLSSECTKVIKITQQDYGVDPIGFREYIQKYKPALWKKSEKKWGEIYKGADVNVNVLVNIRRIGIKK